VNFDKHLPLDERILRIDHIQARRFSKLNGTALEIATEGITRHLRACDRMDVNPDISAVREIIDDALNGRRVYAETSDDRRSDDRRAA
jgi:pyridoxine 5'-phosphate synthase PdxJ